MITFAFDTSNYTTSEAFYDGSEVMNASRLLNVRPGELGLRQSDALFSHVRNLPDLSEQIGRSLSGRVISAVGVSSRPRNVEGSYMPCFLAGVSAAKVLSETLSVPYFEFSHQEGHVAAVIFSSGRNELRTQPFLAWHLSGGTTELLHVEPERNGFRCTKIGGSSDISAGQIIDRTGQKLKLPFPSGRTLDELASRSSVSERFKIKNKGYTFSISGLENKMSEYASSHDFPEDTARYVLNSVSDLVFRVTEEALKEYRNYPVLFSGGVSSNSLLRSKMQPLHAVFGSPAYSTDNAAGIAVLTYWMVNDHG